MKRLMCLIPFIFFTLGVAAAGSTTFSYVTGIQPNEGGTYVSNCSSTRTETTIAIEPCIISPKCGTGKWFYIPASSPHHSTLVSLALASSAAKIPVLIEGTDSCSTGSYEDVKYIVFAN